MEHYSVMRPEAVDLLEVREGGIYVDGTLGLGGHSEAILERIGSGHLYAFDQDGSAIEKSKERLRRFAGKADFIHDNFRRLKRDLESRGVKEVDGIVLDLGVSSPMFDDPARGFSYRHDGPLDMRMDPEARLSARDVVNGYSQKDLERILQEYGEETFAGPIARSIVHSRPLETTFELVEAVKRGIPEKALARKGHPARKTFQAVRIEVNDEMGALEEVLDQGMEILKPGGRMVVISFQSLEDRMVKRKFRDACRVDPEIRKLPLKESEMPVPPFLLLTPRAVQASQEEIEENHRSHSARMRAVQKRETA